LSKIREEEGQSRKSFNSDADSDYEDDISSESSIYDPETGLRTGFGPQKASSQSPGEFHFE